MKPYLSLLLILFLLTSIGANAQKWRLNVSPVLKNAKRLSAVFRTDLLQHVRGCRWGHRPGEKIFTGCVGTIRSSLFTTRFWCCKQWCYCKRQLRCDHCSLIATFECDEKTYTLQQGLNSDLYLKQHQLRMEIRKPISAITFPTMIIMQCLAQATGSIIISSSMRGINMVLSIWGKSLGKISIWRTGFCRCGSAIAFLLGSDLYAVRTEKQMNRETDEQRK